MEFSGYCKINLGLDVVGKREDGYHNLRMVMQTLQLRDVLDIDAQVADETIINMTCSVDKLSCGEDNLCVKAARLILDENNVNATVNIHLLKHIPIAAGLAGGSADAAAVLIGINELLELKMTMEELMALGVKIGADVPYCIMKGTALAEGIGDELTPLRAMVNYPILLAKPSEGISTAEVYGNLELDRIKHPNIDGLVKAIDNDDIIGIATNMGNVLETVTIPRLPVVRDIKRIMMDNKALGAMMSGSGPSVFGIFPNEHQASKALSSLKRTGICETVLITYVYNP